MLYQFALAGAVTGMITVAAGAQSDPYAAFLDEVAQGDGGVCRALVVEQVMARWDGQPQPQDAFASVEAIMADVLGGPEFDAAGCDSAYRFTVLDCTTIDDPSLAHIVPRGIRRGTPKERIALMRACLDQVEAIGLKP